MAPDLELAHDDNLAVYVRSDTTLVLAAQTFDFLQSKVDNMQTRRLMIYSGIVFITGHVSCAGKEIQIHCNELKWDKGAVLDVSGANGQQIPATSGGNAVNGQDAGSVYLHIHSLPLASTGNGATFWPDSFSLLARGGEPGSYHADADGKTWKSGTPGRAGKIAVYYSHEPLRAYLSLYEAYFGQAGQSHVERLDRLSIQYIPAAQANSTSFSNTKVPLQQLESLVSELCTLHINIVQINEMLVKLQTPSSLADVIKRWRSVLLQIRQWPDYSIMAEQDRKSLNDLHVFLMAVKSPLNASDRDTLAAEIQKRLTSLVTNLEKTINDHQDIKLKNQGTLLLTEINTVVKEFWKTELMYHSDLKATPVNALERIPASYSTEGVNDLISPIPLTHPNHCDMELRLADSAYFAEERDAAAAMYNNLRERLYFVPALLKNNQEAGSDITKRKPLLTAYLDLQDRDRLSFWTLDTLSYIYQTVCARIYLLSLKTTRRDLFDFAENFAPRLSTEFYTNYAQQQIKRLGQFETSYWQYFNTYQKQMEAGLTLRQTASANIYQRKEADDQLTQLFKSMKDRELAIQQAEAPLEQKRKALEDALNKVEEQLKKVHAPSAASFLTAIGSCVVAAFAIATGPVGWVAGAAVAGAVIGPQVASLVDEASNTVTDGAGQKVNKAYLLNKLDTCGDDIKSLMNRSAYTMEADGTKIVNEADTAKIAITKEKLDQFLDQFHNAVGSKELSDSLKAFTTATNTRNQDILAYNHAVAQTYQKLKEKSLLEQQAGDISGQLIKENIGLPSIVAYYQRIRNASRMSILRTIKLSALALQFSRVIKPLKFSTTLLSNVDELNAHVDVLIRAQEDASIRSGSLAQSSWPITNTSLGILYQLSPDELAALQVGISDQRLAGTVHQALKVYSIQITSLARAVDLSTTISENPFAGLSNVRVSQVRAWLPGLKLKPIANNGGPNPDQITINIEIKHEGIESVTGPDNTTQIFTHEPIYLNFRYNFMGVRTAADIKSENVVSTHALASDWVGQNTNARIQAPIGPFANWVITLRERDNGILDWTDVKDGYLEFHGSSFPFRQ